MTPEAREAAAVGVLAPSVVGMNMTLARLKDAQRDLTDYAHSSMAPMVMWGGMVRLAGEEPVAASLAAVNLQDHFTMWRALWVTETRVVFCEASKAEEQWTAHSGSSADEADALTVWARPLADINLVELTESRIFRSLREADREWRSGARVRFRDGFRLAVPLFGKRPGNPQDREQLDAVVEALVRPGGGR